MLLAKQTGQLGGVGTSAGVPFDPAATVAAEGTAFAEIKAAELRSRLRETGIKVNWEAT